MTTARKNKNPARSTASSDKLPPLRPPAVPLVVHDPYFSVWSFSDELTAEWPRHWTGANQTAVGLIRVDGKTFRYLGGGPGEVPAARQIGLALVLPTRTVYSFEVGGVQLTLTFTTPALPDDLDLLSRPVTYLTWHIASADGQPHDVSVYLDVQADWCVDSPSQHVEWNRVRISGFDSVQRAGSAAQPVLGRAGDNLRIEWGQVYLAVPADQGGSTTDANGHAHAIRSSFASTGTLPVDDDLRQPRAVHDEWPVLAVALNLGKVAAGKPQSRVAMIAYDDVLAIEYLHRRLPAYWRRDGLPFATMLQLAASEYADLAARCAAFDDELMSDLRDAGGEKYARLCALAYRQALAAHKLVADVDGTPLFFSKENFSNGCIATVDVTYPSAPLFLIVQPELLRGMLTPIFEYARMRRWKFPFAPHDLGTYPLANGQVYGGGEKSERDQMPVEECGNMLILTAALAKVDGNADYARQYWPLVQQWARYLRDAGYDPANQLCTDDFAGHMAHNINLSIKAILGLASYAMLCDLTGDSAQADEYRQLAKSYAQRWTKDADDGDHFRLAFDKPGSWSQKYNLIWDRLLGLNVFPDSVAKKEVAYYRAKQNTPNGLPLDSRNTYTKLDWIIWSACLTGERDDFDALANPAYDWAHTTPSRVPLTDWYETPDGRIVGFQARSVVGGLFIKLLQDEGVCGKWGARADRRCRQKPLGHLA
ncbi:MAG TPA: DUF4965 domain-containing protein [Tepidisphaeraceae bacterium]